LKSLFLVILVTIFIGLEFGQFFDGVLFLNLCNSIFEVMTK